MGIFFAFLSLLDILAGGLIFLKGFYFSSFPLYLGYIILGKGLWSVFSSIMARYYYDWMGIVDILAGVSLILIFYKISILPFQIIAIIVILKGLYCFFTSLSF
jgi:phosphoglycerol transferase MdoB-like AlkP superfamily enzyme